jgi:uncharacterized protein
MKTHLNHVIIGLAIVLTGFLLARAWTKSHERRTSISVTGLASKDFTSDLIVWEVVFIRKSMDLKEAYASLKKDAEQVRQYLLSKGIKESDMVLSAVDIDKQYETVHDKNDNSRQEFTGYMLKQSFQVESKEVDKVEALSRQVTELIDSGIELYSGSPRYYYTQLAQLKITMLAEASKDARERAVKISENAGGSIGELKKADMGVFQITAPNSTEEYSWGGTLNTSSKRKTASITVKLEFSVY